MRHIVSVLCMTAAVGLLTACKDDNQKSAPVVSETMAAEPSAAPMPMSGGVSSSGPMMGRGMPRPPQSDERHAFYCGDQLVVFTFHGDERGSMQIANVGYAMEQTIAASGAKYQNLGDPETYFWTKGDKAWVRVNGKDLPECTQDQDALIPRRAYHGGGNEPGWNVRLHDATMTLIASYGEDQFEKTIITDEKTENKRVVTARDDAGAIVLTITHTACEDDMSGEKFADTLHVAYDGKELRGCGNSLIRHRDWVLEDLNKTGVIDNSNVTLTFGPEGIVSGSGGCNRYSGSYSLEGDNVGIGKNMASTMMACMADSVMAQEQKFLQILPSMKRAEVNAQGLLILSGENGETLRFHEGEGRLE